MTNAQIEAWVLAIVDSVTEGRRVEDARVELKARWPEPLKAARRLAGHANAARGASILWVIGLDEESRTQEGDVSPDTATWYPQVVAEFDGVTPAMHDLIVPTARGNIVALLFETSRAPYLVRNPNFGRVKGEAIAWEVPWREGTRVRSARRGDLLRLLVPVAHAPDIEILKWMVSLRDEPGRENGYGEHLDPVQLVPHLQWDVNVELYVTPKSNELLVLPVHRTTLAVRGAGFEHYIERPEYRVPYVHRGSGLTSDSQTITRTSAEAIVSGPGVLRVSGTLYEERWEYNVPQDIESELVATPAGFSDPITLVTSLRRVDPTNRQSTQVGMWTAEESRIGA